MTRTCAGRRWALVALLLVGGVVLGLAGAFVQAHRVILDSPWGVLVVPWGVPLTWIALVLGVRGGAWLVRSRWGGWAVVIGWLAATVALALESPSGDVAISGGGRQMTYLIVGVILASASASLPVPSRGTSASAGGAGTDPCREPSDRSAPA